MRLITALVIVMMLLVFSGISWLSFTDCKCVSYEEQMYCRCDYWVIIVVHIILWTAIACAATCGCAADNDAKADA